MLLAETAEIRQSKKQNGKKESQEKEEGCQEKSSPEEKEESWEEKEEKIASISKTTPMKLRGCFVMSALFLDWHLYYVIAFITCKKLMDPGGPYVVK